VLHFTGRCNVLHNINCLCYCLQHAVMFYITLTVLQFTTRNILHNINCLCYGLQDAVMFYITLTVCVTVYSTL